MYLTLANKAITLDLTIIIIRQRRSKYCRGIGEVHVSICQYEHKNTLVYFMSLGGYYHGKLVFPKDFPFKPPRIFMITPNGRFKVNTR